LTSIDFFGAAHDADAKIIGETIHAAREAFP
jgi:hypothetical protein